MTVPNAGHLRYALLGLSEIALACADFPLCFAKDGETGRFNLIALLSLDEPRNLYWQNGGWRCTYVPQAALGRGGLMADDLAAAQAMVDRFAGLGLIRAVEMVLALPDGREHEIQGLYTLSPQALADLDDRLVIELFRAGHIAAASLISASFCQLERLEQLRAAAQAGPRPDLRVKLI